MSTQRIIEKKLRDGLSPSHLDVINESHMHNVPPGSESHFKVVIVSSSFSGIKPVARHQKVNGLLKEELNNRVHALSMETLTEEEWVNRQGIITSSPLCLGGSKHKKM